MILSNWWSPVSTRFIASMATYAGLILIFLLWLREADKALFRNLGAEHIALRFPKVFGGIGILDIVVFGASFILALHDPNGTGVTWVLMLFGVFILAGLLMVFVALVWKIEVFRSQPYFIYRTMYGKTYKIQYQDCEKYAYACSAYDDDSHYLILYTGKKKIYIWNMIINIESLVEALNMNHVRREHVTKKRRWKRSGAHTGLKRRFRKRR